MDTTDKSSRIFLRISYQTMNDMDNQLQGKIFYQFFLFSKQFVNLKDEQKNVSILSCVLVLYYVNVFIFM